MRRLGELMKLAGVSLPINTWDWVWNPEIACYNYSVITAHGEGL
jgi:hypothetical protein